MEGIFSGMEQRQPPIGSEEFKKQIVQRYAQEAESVGIDACIGEAVDQVWPAPGYREHQREAVIEILHDLYVEDDDVVTLSAPTGAGKSLILHGVMATLNNEFGRRAFFTTPLNALIDQVDDDEFIADETVTLKGKNNYSCVHEHDAGTSVDNAICQRTDDFDCQHKNVPHTNGGCPYYGRKTVAQNHPEVVTNLSYAMANSMIPDEVDSKLDPRELLVVDECQSIEDFALGFISVVVSDNVIPSVIIEEIDTPPRTDDLDALVEWLQEEVMPPVRARLTELDAKPELTEAEADIEEDLSHLARKVGNLVTDVSNNHWVVSTEFDDGDWKVEFEPIFIGRFLGRFLWSQGHKTVLSSATIPKSDFLEEVGQDDLSHGHVEVESTFPPARRAVYTDETVGKMTMRERDETIPKMANKIASIARHHNQGNPHRGFVHCHSYKIASRLYEALPREVRKRTRVQDGDRREESLDDWLDAPVDEEGLGSGWDDDGRDEGGQIFLSVAMDEGISLDDWRARWQVIAKAAYPYMGPEAKRANYRMDELDDWTWYAGKASINLQQAVGRGMRSKDDWCHTYVLDKSAADLISRNEYLFEDWFLDAVDVEGAEEIPNRYSAPSQMDGHPAEAA